ncbi:hypothetical protein [Promicromonospora soli]|uniref:Uncharacterized protein n=1 Tax=Promicromonospora soli TaxID=2035533 RepID=A0A919G299_9MICO|nr:hypothetical protein [Promicromonospora soli]GHH76309.1 hypothetical protein GCM10017772_34660 [Promicromonospora soli]
MLDDEEPEELEEPDVLEVPDDEEPELSEDVLLDEPDDDESEDDSDLPGFTVLLVDVLRESVR